MNTAKTGKRKLFRSLHIKLVSILILLVVSVMAVVGAFMVNNITTYYLNDFREQVSSVFTTEVISTLERNAHGENAPEKLSDIVFIYATSLGIDSYRNYFILDKHTGSFLTGSNEALGRELTKTANVISAMAGNIGDSGSMTDPFMDIAIPVDGESDNDYIVYIKDTKQELTSLTITLFETTVQAILFGFAVAILLSFLLSKTMTIPIENLTRGARRVAEGDFNYVVEVQSTDEIGTLTNTFNDMANVLKKTLEEAENERNKLDTLFTHMNDGVAAFLENGDIIHMNLAAEQMLGVTFSENLKFSDVFKELTIESTSDIDDKKFVKSQIVRGDRRYNVFFAQYGIADETKGIMTVIHDVTEQHALDNARREFVANVSHELRTPLTNIKSYTETLSDADDIPPEMQAKFLGVISSEADRMTRIVKDLLTLSKLDYGRMDMNFSKLSFKKVLKSVFEALRLEAIKHNHEFNLDMLANLPSIYGDRERIEQVFVNIISNAIKYTPDGGKIDVFAGFRNENYIFVKVVDTGLGIPKEDIPRLFERFYRVDKARSRERGGTGLGLAIAQEIIEVHGGSISIESTLEVGTTMIVTLPIYKNQDMDSDYDEA